MERERDKMLRVSLQSLHCYNCSLDFLNSHELKFHECSKDEKVNDKNLEEEEEEASLTDMEVDVKQEVDEEENDETTSLKIVQVISTNSNYNSGSNQLNQHQQSNICLIGEDGIEVNCKKCSTDFSSLKSFLDHLHKKPHLNVRSQISKENQPPSNINKKVPVVNSTSQLNKQVKSTSNQNLSQKQPEESTSIDNDLEVDPPETPIDSNKKSSGSSSNSNSGSDADAESDLDLDADPSSDPLQLTPSELKSKSTAKFTCSYCEQKMNSKSILKAHMNKTIPRTKCLRSDCPLTFTLNCALLKHHESHRKEFECQANTQKNSPKTYSRAHRSYPSKEQTSTTTTTTATSTATQKSSFAIAFSSFSTFQRNPTESGSKKEPKTNPTSSHPFQCNREDCPKVFANKLELTRHIHGHDINEKFQKYIRCPHPNCRKPFGRKRQMYLYHAHVENHKLGRIFKCRRNPISCSREFERLIDLTRHEKKCTRPGNSTKPKTETESKFTSHRCPFCSANVWFPGIYSFLFHIKKSHPQKTQEDIDKALEPSFVKTPSGKYKCTKPECDQLEFESKDDVKLHTNRVHRTVVIRPAKAPPQVKKEIPKIPCTYYEDEGCERIFKSEMEVRAHCLRVHDKPKSQLCSTCGKVCRDSATLRVHEETHNDERNFKCDTCEQFFKTRNTLLRHKITHTDLKKYPCSECGRAFRTSDAHNVHMRLHTEDRRFRCPICPDVGYNHKVTLKLHMEKVHPEFEGQL